MPPAGRHGPVRRTVDDTGTLAAQVHSAASDAELAARSADIAAGLIPVWARRSMHPHEIAARVSFATIDANETAAAGGIARRLIDDRARFVDLLVADLTGAPSGRAVVDRLVELETAGLTGLPGSASLMNATAVDVAAALRQHADVAGTLALSEAAQQGAGSLGLFALDADAAAQLEQLAHRLAVAPHVDVIRALRDEAVRLPTPPDAAGLVPRLASAAGDLSPAPLEGAARAAVAQADGLGRQSAAAAVPSTPVLIYASELLDGNTCGPCSLIDGHEYPDLATARRDYPNGIYLDCEGRERCRGTLVFVWATEAPPTV